VYQAVADDVIG